MKTVKNNIPELRFSEFSDKWKSKKLGEKINFQSGYAFESQKMLKNKGFYQLIKMSNVYKNKLTLDRSPSFFEKIESKLNKFLLKKDDTVLTLTGTVGKTDFGYSAIITKNNRFLLNQRLVRLRKIDLVSDNFFISYLIKTSKFYYNFFNEGKGGTGNQSNVGIDDVKNIILNFPQLQEQQKIASFLTEVDTKITQLKKKKELLKQYKKGIMQQIFNQEIRFKDNEGNEYPKWKVKMLGELFLSYKGKGIPKGVLDENGINKCVLYGELYTKYNEVIFDVRSRTNSQEGLKSKKGDLLIPSSTTTTGIDLANVTALNTENVLLGGDIIVLRGNQKINNVFYAYYLSNHKKHQIASRAQGITIVHLYYNSIKGLKIDIPYIEEQNKIANFLSSIDDKINQISVQLERTQTFKKGLLQQMFV